MKRVVLESPFGASTDQAVAENIAYAKKCLLDSILRGETPIASHLLIAAHGVLNDRDEAERALGIEVGFVWSVVSDGTVVYVDRGISAGMTTGIRHAARQAHHLSHRRDQTVRGGDLMASARTPLRIVWKCLPVFVASVSKGERRLVASLSSPDGVSWTGIAVLTSGNDVDEVLDSHAHEKLCEGVPLETAFSIARKFLRDWKRGSGSKSTKCPCKPMKKPARKK